MDAKELMVSQPKSCPTRIFDRPLVPLLKTHKQADLLVRKFSLAGAKWDDLDPNILRQILCQIPLQHIFCKVSSVCQSWETECWDFMFWNHNVLDLSMTGAGFGMIDMSTVVVLSIFERNSRLRVVDSSESYTKMSSIFMKKLRRIMEGESLCASVQSWRNNIQTVILPYNLEISDTQLLYIAERTPSVQHLFLLCPCKVTVSGFNKAIKKWKNVKEIHLGPLNEDVFCQFVGDIGKNCHKLESLHIHQKNFVVDKSRALAIGKSLPGLRKLEIELGDVEASGFATLFNMCLQLEEVYFNFCRMMPDSQLMFGPPDPYWEFFQLTWTVGEEGYTKWEVKPYATGIERLEGHAEKTEMAEYLSSAEYLENEKARLQADVENWIARSATRTRVPFFRRIYFRGSFCNIVNHANYTQ